MDIIHVFSSRINISCIYPGDVSVAVCHDKAEGDDNTEQGGDVSASGGDDSSQQGQSSDNTTQDQQQDVGNTLIKVRNFIYSKYIHQKAFFSSLKFPSWD